MPTNDSLDLIELDRLERKMLTTQVGFAPGVLHLTLLEATNLEHQLRPLLDLVDRLGEALDRALTTTENIERTIHQRHFNPGTLQKMADAVDDYRRAKGENVEPRPPF